MMAFSSLTTHEAVRPVVSVKHMAENLLPSPPQELFEIASSKTTLIVTQKGSRLTFPALGWRTPDGRLFSGEVRLTLMELTTPAEIIAAGLGTTTEDRLLEMPVLLYLSAFAGKTRLELTRPIDWELPLEPYQTINPLSQQLYRATPPSLRVCGATSLYDWQLVGTKKTLFSTLYKKQHLLFQLTDTGWWGLGAPIKCRHNRKMVSIKTSGLIPALSEQKTFIVFKLNNSIIRMHEGIHHFTSFHVPGCHNAVVISFGGAGHQLYGGHVELDSRACIAELKMKATGFEALSVQL